MSENQTVYIVDDDESSTSSLAALMMSIGRRTETYSSAEESLAAANDGMRGCLILDVRLRGMSGPELSLELQRRGVEIPTIFISGDMGSIGAEFMSRKPRQQLLEKPYSGKAICEAIDNALNGAFRTSA